MVKQGQGSLYFVIGHYHIRYEVCVLIMAYLLV